VFEHARELHVARRATLVVEVRIAANARMAVGAQLI
jgi:hypothetical protein